MLRRCVRRLVTPPVWESEVNWPDHTLNCNNYGQDVLQDPLWNKGLAFDTCERDRLGLRGLLPPAIRTLEQQQRLDLQMLRSRTTDQQKNLFLQNLHGRNETLYHRLLCDNIEELAPLVYTPTVGEVCQEFGSRFTNARGLFFSTQDRGQFGAITANWPHTDVHVIVVTDGSRILGLGDLGAQGMGIPIGKLALYCAAGGLAPHRVLPVMLDVGTNNEKLLNNEAYIGVRHKRLEGKEYFDMVDEFMVAVTRRWPNVCVQFEDFETSKALPLLKKYRNKFRCFNDDIQGTGTVTAAGIMSAARVAGVPIGELRVVIAGGGSAGQGVATSIQDCLVNLGLDSKVAHKRIVIVDHNGIVGAYNKDSKHADIDDHLASWRNDQFEDCLSLQQAIEQHKPHVLLGLTSCPGLFTEKIIKTMASNTPRPIIMPMSNPSAKVECTPADVYKWTDGRAIVATGSPFGPVTLKIAETGETKTLVTSQCNNMYVFPGLGLAASVGGVKTFEDRCFFEVTKTLAESLTEAEMKEGRTFPCLGRIRDVSRDVAVAVIKSAYDRGLTMNVRKHHVQKMSNLRKLVKRRMYHPHYAALTNIMK